MASVTSQGVYFFNKFKKLSRFNRGLAAQLPEAYKKFWKEWKETKPTAVHYIPKEGEWIRDEVTGEVRPVQNIPLPVIDPPESNEGLWGGEGVIRGFKKPHPLRRRVPHFWVPVLQRSVVYSAVLNKYMSVVVTERTINLIHESHGFDHYLLKTPACDLRSTLALTLKRKILLSLRDGCSNLEDQPEKQQEILEEYERYLDQYTSEEIEWYGLTFQQAIKKLIEKMKAEKKIVPHKIEFRSKLIEQLREAQSNEADFHGDDRNLASSHLGESSWLSKMNPFGKKQET